jgi:YcaO-like protein with predicted kinase domain
VKDKSQTREKNLSRSEGDQVIHRLGTFRNAPPAKSLLLARHAAKICGVSRLASVTGLDHIGVPVWAAIRPLGRSLSVSQGKGLTDALAQVSALMEAIELFHAETLLPTGIKRSIKLTVHDSSFIDVQAMPVRSKANLNFDAQIRWLEARSVITDKPHWIPRELVDLDTTRPYDGLFVSSSNGLASGNSQSEALFHGLCEILERDQVSHWVVVDNLSTDASAQRLNLRKDLPSSAERIIAMIESAGLTVAVWYCSITVDVPCFACAIADMEGNTLYPQQAAGYGCHVSKEIALLRALTEAAQSRLTFISGARDDLFLTYYQSDIPSGAPMSTAWYEKIRLANESILYGDLPDFSNFDSFSEAVEFIVSCMLRDGVSDVLMLDLTNDKIGVPVVHVSAPYAEYDVRMGICDPGLRLCRFLKAQEAARSDASSLVLHSMGPS